MISLYKCPNCGGSMVFMPEKGNFKCEYCTSVFSENELHGMELKQQGENLSAFGEENKDFGDNPSNSSISSNEKAEQDVAFYNCPQCGAEIACPATQMVNTCFYCHSSVIRLNASNKDFKPDLIIPFEISKEKAIETFLKWAKKKKFVPKNFFCKEQIENLTGVYFPYWLTSVNTNCSATFSAEKVERYISGNTEYITTKKFLINRSGEFNFPNMANNALKKADARFVESVLPFDWEKLKKYSPAFLLGFQAECRDTEKEELEKTIDSDVHSYANGILQNSVMGYTNVYRQTLYVKKISEKWNYALLPIWTITYKSKNGKIYSFALNGQNGTSCGELPISRKKMFGLFTLVTLVTFALVSALEYFLC